MTEKEITIYDIARILGISPATVSRALNDHPAINSKTKLTIVSKAQELGYRSNTFASNLRTGRTHTLGVIVPRLNSNFMSAVLAGMEEIANVAGYNLLISQSLELEKKEKTNARTMFNSRVDGLLASVAYDTDSFDHFEAFIAKGVPVVFFDRVITHPDCTQIIIDNVNAGYEATAHLIAEGCRRIMHVTGDLRRNVYEGRLQGYRQALRENAIVPDDSLVMTSDLSQEAGKLAAERIAGMHDRPDGIFIANDLCAVTCMKALKEKGFDIPGDIAVVGFNNDPVSQVIEPNLTTVFYPGYQMGKVAVKTIIAHLNGTSVNIAEPIILRSELLVRGSSKKRDGLLS